MPAALIPSQVHVDAALTQFSIAFMNDGVGFVADKVFPVVNVQKQSDVYYTFARDTFLRSAAARRAPGTKAAEKLIALSTGRYFCETWAIEGKIPDETRANADPAINLDMTMVNGLTEDMMIRREAEFVTAFMTTGVWATDTTPANLWSDGANSDPISDIAAQKVTIKLATGKNPNKLVVGRQVHEQLKKHPLIVERLKGITVQMTNLVIAQVLDVEEYLVADAVQTTSAPGLTITNAFLVGKNALLVHTPTAPSLMTPAAGYIVAWNAYNGQGGLGGVAVDVRRDNETVSDVIRCQFSFDMLLTSSALGAFFSNVVA